MDPSTTEIYTYLHPLSLHYALPICFDRGKVARYGALLSDKETNPGIAVGPGDPAAVLMTSGTTGPSKGVVMLHSQFYFFAEEDVQLTRLTADDVYMTGFPLFHGNAQFQIGRAHV